MTNRIDSSWIAMYIVGMHIGYLVFRLSQPKLLNIFTSFRWSRPFETRFSTYAYFRYRATHTIETKCNVCQHNVNNEFQMAYCIEGDPTL